MTIYMQTAWLFLLAIPIACIAWTVTQEEVLKVTSSIPYSVTQPCK